MPKPLTTPVLETNEPDLKPIRITRLSAVLAAAELASARVALNAPHIKNCLDTETASAELTSMIQCLAFAETTAGYLESDANARRSVEFLKKNGDRLRANKLLGALNDAMAHIYIP